jgi:hypothetical protein
MPPRRLLAFAIVFAALPVLACEPILPLAMLFGPWMLALRWGLVALAVVVAIKCLAFALLQRGALSWGRAVAAMFVANVVSTIAGLLAGLTYVFPAVGLGGIVAVIVVSWLPARRLGELYPRLRRFSVAIAVVLYVASTVLFVGAQVLALRSSMVAYWLTKYAYVVCALLISMVLTTFWEEWVIWRMSGGRDSAFVTPVFRANAIALFVVMLAVAIAVLPERMRSSDFLLALLHRIA